jgi:site-specific DNA-methyltransferase (adenine-specific)
MIELENAVVYHGSNLDVLPTLPDNSVDAIVTDPPYELGFMGKSWDSSGIAYSVELWQECLRVLKPGGHLLAFGGSRTWHRIAVAIEDAGFDVRDSIAWLYGSGFPKSLDISKAIDKAAGAEREVIGSKKLGGNAAQSWEDKSGKLYAADTSSIGVAAINVKITAPATDEAKQWAGWGTALKPAFEPIVVARKPLPKGSTVAANVLEWGVGGLNIDGSRIGTTETWNRPPQSKNEIYGKFEPVSTESNAQGRWPANIILDDFTAGLLDQQSGISKSTPFETDGIKRVSGSRSGGGLASGGSSHTDSGGASRFFYVAKASKKDRNEGLENIEGQEIGAKGNGLARTCATCGATVLDGCQCPDRTYVNPTRQNFHPTVKPTALMEYLVKLVTPPGGVVLDPFTGSGSTGKAALLNGFKFIGIELTAEYLPIIKGRLEFAARTFEQQAKAEKEKESETLF